MEKLDDYSDIIDLPHYEPQHHIRMRREARAAQFAPFAALTGFRELLRKIEKENEEKYTCNYEKDVLE